MIMDNPDTYPIKSKLMKSRMVFNGRLNQRFLTKLHEVLNVKQATLGY